MVTFYSVEKINNNISLGDVIIKGLEEHETKNRDGRLYASDSALCERKGVLSSSQNIISKSSGLKPFYTESGKTAETVSLKGLDNSGILLYADYKLPDIGINLGGYVDGIIHWKDKIYILEIKQVGQIPASVKKEHESQAMIYSAITGFPAVVLYLDRQVSDYTGKFLSREFYLDSSYEHKFMFLKRAVFANLCNDRKLIPQKPSYMKKSHCGYCDFKPICWGDSLDFSNWERQGFNHITPEQTIEIDEEANTITNQLLNKVVVKNRTTGIIKFLAENGRENAKKLLVGKDWSSYYE